MSTKKAKANLDDVVSSLQNILQCLNDNRGMGKRGSKTKLGKSADTDIEDLIASYSGRDSKYDGITSKFRDYKKLKDAVKGGNTSAKGSAKNAKGALMAAIGNEVIGAIRDTLQMFVKGFSAYYEIQKTNIRAEKTIMSKRLELYGDVLKKAGSNLVTMVTGDLTDAMYNSFKNNLDFGLSEMNKRIEMRQTDYDRAINNNITNLNALNDTIGQAIGITSQNFMGAGAPWAAIVGTVLGAAQEIMRATSQIEIERLKAEQEIITQANDFRKQFNEEMFGYAKTQGELGEAVDKILMKVDNSAYELARAMGVGAQSAIDYKNAVLDAGITMSELGKSWEDMIKIQQSYVENSDRNIKLTGREGEQVSAIGMLFGIGDNESAGIMGAMNIFNKSIEDGSDMMFTMYKTASKMGLSNQKFAKDLQNTLKLSQRYQFKGGVKGVMDMALWSQKVRMNLSDMESALSKLHTGNIEDTIQTSARLNVLGGNAALYSDPMGMLFNAYQDPKKYMENINKMVSGFGSINQTSGETTFSIAEQMRIEQIANATGVSAESLMNQARQANKAGVIRKRFGNKFGENMDYIANNALWDEKQGTWVVNVLENGKVGQKTLENLTNRDIENIFPEDNQEQLISYVKNILSIMEEQHGVENFMRQQMALGTSDEHANMHRNVNSAIFENFMQNMDYYEQTAVDVYSSVENAQMAELELQKKLAEEYRKNGKTLIKITSEMSTEAFRKNLENFADMVAAFSSEDAFMLYMKQINPELYEALLKAKGNTSQDIKDMTGGADFWKGASKIGGYFLNPFELITDWREGSLLANVNASKAGRFIGAQMQEGTLDAYKQMKGIEIKTGNDRRTAQRALEENYITINKDTGEVVWGDLAGELGKKPGTPIYDTNGKPLAIHRGNFSGFQNANGSKSQSPWLDEVGNNLLGGNIGSAANNILRWSVDDAIITPHGRVYTHPDDMIAAFKPNGDIMKGLNGNDSTKLEVSGTLRLETNGQSVDLMELIRNNPESLRRLTEEVLITADKTYYGGRSKHAPNRFTLG